MTAVGKRTVQKGALVFSEVFTEENFIDRAYCALSVACSKDHWRAFTNSTIKGVSVAV